MKNIPLGRNRDLVVQELDGEVMIYDLTNNKAFCLNETSALVWQMCDGNKSVSEISTALGKKLKTPANEDLVWLAIDQLKKEKLIINGADLHNNFEGMTRRQVIKKVGLASMIALPVIAGMVAPTSVHAQSVCGALQGTACTCNNLGPLNGETCASMDCMTGATGCVCASLTGCMGGSQICTGTCGTI